MTVQRPCRPSKSVLLPFLLISAAALACGGSDDPASTGLVSPYGSGANETVVVGDGQGGVGHVTPAGEGCIQIGAECVQPQKRCNDRERADVVVDATGKVVAIVATGASAPLTIDSTATSAGQGEQGRGHRRPDDGVDIAGDVTSSGNKVTVYGEARGLGHRWKRRRNGNNFAMRGVTVKNVTVDSNASLVLCAIEVT